mmetsp:Transcript_30994/g.65988  ORF Transcript_30994/g.65988 Transcript_30994/m.65988 type:complete len:396 (+) Transcript_30994:30-1217(+)
MFDVAFSMQENMRTGFQLAARASEARSLLDCAALATPVHPSAAVSPGDTGDKNVNEKQPVLFPWVGFGTYRLGKGRSRSATLQALNNGYRHIDTAFVYGGETTEIEVGKAIQDALQRDIIQSREELFVTTKQWRDHHGYDASMKCLDKSLKRLGLDYVDCWMMHWPGPCWKSKPRQEKDRSKGTKRDHESEGKGDDPWVYAKVGQDEIASLRAETWRAMEDAYRQGKARCIAVSNFTIQHLETLKETATLWPPAVNQVECHPYYSQRDLREYCQKEGIVVQAYAALGGQDGTKAKWKALGGKLLETAPVIDAAKRLGKSSKRVTSAQVLLRWALQNNCALVPKTCSPERMRENADVFDFALTEEEMLDISSIAPSVEGEGRICWRTEPLRMLNFS